MPKPKISATAAVKDIRSGMNDPALMKKYGLTPQGLRSFITKLLEAGFLSRSDLELLGKAAQKTVPLPAPEASIRSHGTSGTESSGSA